jgi:hypothetical protein
MSGLAVGEDPGTLDSGPRWIKSSLSFANNNCVEVARLPDGQIGVRDSKTPERAILRITSAGWQAFLAAARHGEFDSPGKP